MKAKEIIIFGCGGHSRSVVDVLLSYETGISLLFVDSGASHGETLFGFPVVTESNLKTQSYFFAIGSNEKRRILYEKIGSQRLMSIISPKSYIGRGSCIEAGVFIGNFTHIGPQAKIGENSILNNGSIVEHEVIVGRHCHIGPRAVISGRCRIGDGVFVGVGATIKDSISICSDVTIGAGAVIVKDITEPGVYIGCPGRKMARSEQTFPT